MKPTALFAGFLLALFSVAPGVALAQEFKNGDFSKGKEGWDVSFLNELEAKVSVIPDGFEGKPALAIEVPETDISAWKGRMTQVVTLPSAGTYTVTFCAKVDPNDVDITAIVLSTAPGEIQPIGSSPPFKLIPEWKEFSFEFSVDESHKSVLLMWANLARGGSTFSFANMRIVRE